MPETFLKAPAESSAQPQSFAGLQDDLVVAFRVELEGANPVEAHDDGAVDADESRSAQIDLELRQGPAKEVRGAADESVQKVCIWAPDKDLAHSVRSRTSAPRMPVSSFLASLCPRSSWTVRMS